MNPSEDRIHFNKPYLSGNELEYIRQAVSNRKISGNGAFTQKCQQFFETKYGFKKTLLTTSCTDALEMAAILIDIRPGDEVIIPSYTFVSTCNAFVLRGAKIVFADSQSNCPNMDADLLEPLINEKTKAIVPVHYAGMACDMDKIMALASKYKLFVVEDAAQAIDSFYKGRPLGSIGHLSAFSFHETKNIISGEGGMLVINDEQFVNRAEIIWEKGTNRSAFFRGEVNKYGWVDIGSSFLPSEMIAAFLFAQLENLEKIQKKRKHIWSTYHTLLQGIFRQGKIKTPELPGYALNNAHMFYILCRHADDRTRLIKALNEQNIFPVFHYLSLHKSPYYHDKHDGRSLPHADRYTDTLLRLPFYYELSDEQISRVCEAIIKYYVAW